MFLAPTMKKTHVERKRKRTKRQHHKTDLPDELVFEILTRLPVKSLVRFKTVSKAWQATISDPFFVRAHLGCSKRRQQQSPSSFLITPQVLLQFDATLEYCFQHASTDIHFYRWNLEDFDNSSRSSTTATLLCRKHFPDGEFGPVSLMAHRDGLVLLPTNTKAYVFNPAMGDVVALPESRRNMSMKETCLPVGFGLDASNGRYKVARSFYRRRRYKPREIITMGMEVFTIGGGGGEDGSECSWRQTLADPPYPILSSQTGTYCMGYLFFLINKSNQEQPPNGVLRFSLQDETFGATLYPANMEHTVDDEDIRVMELDGELCCTYFSKSSQRQLIWMAGDALDPQWDCRYTIHHPQLCYPVASLGSAASVTTLKLTE